MKCSNVFVARTQTDIFFLSSKKNPSLSLSFFAPSSSSSQKSIYGHSYTKEERKKKRVVLREHKKKETHKKKKKRETREREEDFTPLLIKFWTSKIQNKARVVCGERTNKRTREDVLETLETSDVFVDGE